MNKQSLSESHSSNSTLSVWSAILIGWLIVNIPALVIMAGIVVFGLKIKPTVWWLFLIIGIITGWMWWSYTIPRWRRWAHERGASPNKLQRASVVTGLAWAKGSVFEKTEVKIDD